MEISRGFLGYVRRIGYILESSDFCSHFIDGGDVAEDVEEVFGEEVPEADHVEELGDDYEHSEDADE